MINSFGAFNVCPAPANLVIPVMEEFDEVRIIRHNGGD